MPTNPPLRAHVVAGGFPPGQYAGHDHDYARLRLLEMLADAEVPASVSNDFSDTDKWLTRSKLLITYVSGPYPDAQQTAAIRQWLADGGRWLGLHGTSGGRAVRVGEGERPRRQMVKMDYHEVLGGFFINHPPVRRFNVDVRDADDLLTRGLPTTFEVIDEPYMIEVQDPANSRILLTSELGPDPTPGFGFYYEKDTALMADGKTRALGFTKDLGKGGVCYIALGHCHNWWSNSQPFVDKSVNPEGKTPIPLRVTWEAPAFQQLLRNAIEWGMTR
jgi:type 1 glutamine amidotransferase